jgi:hypothetical protein
MTGSVITPTNVGSHGVSPLLYMPFLGADSISDGYEAEAVAADVCQRAPPAVHRDRARRRGVQPQQQRRQRNRRRYRCGVGPRADPSHRDALALPRDHPPSVAAGTIGPRWREIGPASPPEGRRPERDRGPRGGHQWTHRDGRDTARRPRTRRGPRTRDPGRVARCDGEHGRARRRRGVEPSGRADFRLDARGGHG